VINQSGRTKRTIQVIFCTVFLMVVSSLAEASLGTVDIAYSHRGAGYNIHIWGGGRNSYAFSGELIFNKSDGFGAGNIWPDKASIGFCIELNQAASSSIHAYDVVMPQNAQHPQTFLGGPIGSVKAAYISELWQEHFDPAWAAGGSANNHKAASFQAALWEIIYEDIPAAGAPVWNVTLDGTIGPHGFRCAGLADGGALANNWLNSLDMQGPQADLRALVNCCKQDYIIRVPEPATIALLGLGSLILMRKRPMK
jgi:hypothetical protein